MAVDLSKLVSRRKITLDELNNKTIAIDAYNVIYQFLSIIRQPDGTPLMDSHGNVTSHLSGLFYRTIEIINHGVNPIYVFDGIPSILKQKTIAARIKHREEQRIAWEHAKEKGMVEEARVHAQGSTRITKEIVASSKALLDAMGIGYIAAPGEGEAQACTMCKAGQVYAAASQDYDTMLFGSPLVIRNMAITGKRKLPRKNIYVNVEPEEMNFADTLSSLGITHQQLIWIGIMLGTDFNEGIGGVGPKTALKITREAKSIDDIKRIAKGKYSHEFELDISEVEALFLNPEVKDISAAEVKKLQSGLSSKDKIAKFMCDEHDFGEDRISKYAEKLAELRGAGRQRGIGSWFKDD